MTELTVPITVCRFEQLSDCEEITDVILTLARQDYTDKAIATQLTNSGHRSPRSDVVLASTVSRIRKQHGIIHQEKLACPHVIDGDLRPNQLAKRLRIRPHWIYDRIRNGTIKITKHSTHKAFLFPDTQETIDKLQQFIDGKVPSISF